MRLVRKGEDRRPDQGHLHLPLLQRVLRQFQDNDIFRIGRPERGEGGPLPGHRVRPSRRREEEGAHSGGGPLLHARLQVRALLRPGDQDGHPRRRAHGDQGDVHYGGRPRHSRKQSGEDGLRHAGPLPHIRGQDRRLQGTITSSRVCRRASSLPSSGRRSPRRAA